MRKILVLLLVFGLVLGFAGVVSASLSVTPSKTTANVSETITFTVSGLTDTANLSKYVWNFDDSDTTTDSGTTPTKSHSYSAAKTYRVTVTAYNTTGAQLGSAATCPVTITAPVTPVAAFSFTPTGGSAPLEVSFRDASTGSPTSYSWNFGDGNTSTDRNPTHTFRDAKTYTIELTVTQGSLSNTTRKTLIVSAAPVVVVPAITSLTISPSVGVVSSPVQFTAVVTGDPTTYEWDFGDGNTQTGESSTIQHTYNVVQNYTAKLTVKNAKGNATKTVNVVVKDGGVSINTNVSSGKVPLTVNFTAVTNIEVAENNGFKWDLHPNATTEYGKSVTYTYTEPGEYTVTLSVTPKVGGGKIEKTVKITAKEDVLDASFTASTTSGAAPLAVKFTDTSSGATAWAWSIYKTDSGSRTLQKEFTDRNISYTFQNAGTYQVELIAKKGSHSDSETKEITVSAKATTAPTTKATTKATTAPTSAATTSPAVKAAALSSDDNPVPNPMDIIEEFIRLIKVMLVPENYNLAI